MQIHFSIPDFYWHFDISSGLARLIEKRPEMLNPGVVVDSVYGSFPNALWNGGRVCFGTNDSQNVEDTLAFYNDRGWSVRYTFTNCLIEKEHLLDRWCNMLMEKADNGKNAVVVNSALLDEHVRENYPNFARIGSTTKCIANIDDFNAECEKDYSLCVLHYDFNNNFEALKQIAHPEKTEILVDEACNENCPLRELHYRSLSRWQMDYKPNKFKRCANYSYADAMKRRHYISYRDIVEKYVPLGFTHFKLAGRTAPKQDVIEGYVQHLIRPEYQMEARLLLFAGITGSQGANITKQTSH